MHLKRFKLSLIFAGSINLVAADVAATYDFKDLIEIALHQSPEIKAVECSVQDKDRLVMAQRAQYFPKVVASASSNHDDHFNYECSDFTVQLTQPIFDPTVIVKNRLAATQKSMAQINAELERTKVYGVAEFTWLKAWLEQQRETLNSLSLKVAQQDFAKEQKKITLGMLSELQAFAVTSKLKNEEKKQAQYYDSLNSAFVELERVLGGQVKMFEDEVRAQLKFVDDGFILPSKEECLAKALDNRQETRLLQRKIELEQQNKSLAYSGYLPVVSGFVAAKRSSNHHDDVGAKKWRGRAGMKATWAFFDGAGHKFEAEAAAARALRGENELELAKVKIEAEVIIAFNAAQIKKHELDLQTIKLQEDFRAFCQAEARYKNGLIALLEKHKANLLWTEAQFTWLTHKIALQQAFAALKNRCGNPSEWC